MTNNSVSYELFEDEDIFVFLSINVVFLKRGGELNKEGEEIFCFF